MIPITKQMIEEPNVKSETVWALKSNKWVNSGPISPYKLAPLNLTVIGKKYVIKNKRK